MNNENLKNVIERSQQGEEIAFKSLVEQYQAFAFNLAFRLTCIEEDAKDVVQESFVKIWKHIKKFNTETKFTTWLYKIVYNQSLDRIKANKRRWAVHENYNHISDLAENLFENPENEHLNRDLSEIIKILAKNLTPKQYAVFVLHDLQGAEMEEIVQITSLNKGTIKSNLYYARLNIREKLEKLEQVKMPQNEL